MLESEHSLEEVGAGSWLCEEEDMWGRFCFGCAGLHIEEESELMECKWAREVYVYL